MSYKQWNIKNKVIFVIIILLIAISLTTSGLIFAIIASFSGFFYLRQMFLSGEWYGMMLITTQFM